MDVFSRTTQDTKSSSCRGSQQALHNEITGYAIAYAGLQINSLVQSYYIQRSVVAVKQAFIIKNSYLLLRALSFCILRWFFQVP